MQSETPSNGALALLIAGKVLIEQPVAFHAEHENEVPLVLEGQFLDFRVGHEIGVHPEPWKAHAGHHVCARLPVTLHTRGSRPL